MKIKTKEEIKIYTRTPLYGKRDYYFHADEDFREDREWGKIKADNSKASASTGRTTINA
jgi:hypothetical protein